MDDYLSLRSLEGSGRPFGTERSPSPERARERQKGAAEISADRSLEVRESKDTPEPERSEFSRKLGQLEAAQEPIVDQPEPTLPEEAAPVVAAPQLPEAPLKTQLGLQLRQGDLASESAPTEALVDVPQTAGAPPVELTGPKLPITEPKPSTLELAAPVLAPPLEVAPQLAAGLAPVVLPVASTPAQEGPTLPSVSALATPIELATNLEAGSGSLDADTGGLTNQAAELTASSAPKADPSALQFEQALAETSNKTASSPTRNVEVVESVLRQFKVQVNAKLDRAMIQLHPAELGRISVRIEMEKGRMRAVLRADKAETLELLERHVPELRASLEGSGIQAESFDFGLGLEQNDQDQEQLHAPTAWKDQTEPILEELEKRSLLTKSFVNEKRVDTYA